MPTLTDLETAVADYKRAKKAFSDASTSQADLLAQLGVLQTTLETAKASMIANEEALRGIAEQYGRGI